jgi:hypothetical protein
MANIEYLDQKLKTARVAVQARSVMGNVMTFLVNSEQTDGAFSMREYLSKPGNEPPAHVHDRKMSSSMYWKAASMPIVVKRSSLRARTKECTFQSSLSIIHNPHPAIANADLDVAGRFRRILPRYERTGRSLGLPEHAVNSGEVDMDYALREGNKRGISFLSSEEIRQRQMPPPANFLAP